MSCRSVRFVGPCRCRRCGQLPRTIWRIRHPAPHDSCRDRCRGGTMAAMALPLQTGAWPDHIDAERAVDDLETLPDDGLRYELLDGTLIVSPAPVPRHQRAILRLVLLLSAACPTDHEVFVAPLDWQPDRRTSLEPDLLVVRKDRIGEKNITQPPAIVIEVLSPGTARIDQMLKFSRYQ